MNKMNLVLAKLNKVGGVVFTSGYLGDNHPNAVGNEHCIFTNVKSSDDDSAYNTPRSFGHTATEQELINSLNSERFEKWVSWVRLQAKKRSCYEEKQCTMCGTELKEERHTSPNRLNALKVYCSTKCVAISRKCEHLVQEVIEK